MKSAAEFAGAIDSLTGQVTFDLPIASLPGPEHLQLGVALTYTSALQFTVDRWNLTHPTGVVGLGWTLPRSSIFVERGVELAATRIGLVHAGVVTRLIYAAEEPGGKQRWLAVDRPFWRIQYAPSAATWTLINEHGIRYTFGGTRGTQYSVAIGDWLASSTAERHQLRVPNTWNLVSISDRFGNRCRYTYEFVEQTLGRRGEAYSQASYLAKISGAWGDELFFHYVDKGNDEVAYPFTNPNPPNAYQAYVDTKALSMVSFQPADLDSTLWTTTFTYDTSFQGGDGTKAAFTKRLLTSMQLAYVGGRTLPSLDFSYATDPARAVKLGALKSVTTPEGATVAYTYGRAGGSSGTLQFSERTTAVTPPRVTGLTFRSPRVLFAESFVVVTWLGSDSSLAIQPYRWEGRWLAGTLTTVPNAVTLSYHGIQTASWENGFGVLAQGKLFAFARDPARPEAWIRSGGLSVGAPAGNTGFLLAAGDDFLATACLPSGDLYRFDFSNLSWSASSKISTNLSSPVPTAWSLSARSNKLLLVGASSASVELWLGTRRIDRTWTSSRASVSASLGVSIAVSAKLSSTAAAVLAGGAVGSHQFINGYAVALTGDGALGRVTSLYSDVGALADTPFEVQGMTLRIQTSLWRYSGSNWAHADLAQLGLASGDTLVSLSMGQDVGARVVTLNDGTKRCDLVAYDANTATWSVKASANPPARGVGVAVAPTTPLEPSRYAVLAQQVYYMSSDQSWTAVTGGLPASISAMDAPSISIQGSEFLAYQTTIGSASSTQVAFLANGGIAGAVASVSGSLLVPSQPADALVGTHALASYEGTWDGDGFALSLHRPIAGAMSGPQSATVVTQVSTTSGYAGTSITLPDRESSGPVTVEGTLVTSFAFDTRAATVSPMGDTPLFNHVTFYPGASSAAPGPGGQADLYQFNGLSAGESLVLPPPNEPTKSNAALVPSLVLGRSYTSTETAVTGGATEVVSRRDDYWWGALNPQVSGHTSYLRTRRSVRTLDGVAQTADTTYDEETGFPLVTTSSRVDGSGNTITTTLTRTYFWQQYDRTRSLNLLSPVVQLVQEATTTPAHGTSSPEKIAACVTTWSDQWPTGSWAPAASYRMLRADAPAFSAWSPGSATPLGWQRTFAIENYDVSGLVTEMSDLSGVKTVYQLDKDHRFGTASAYNATTDSFAYYGFEPYEQSAGWRALVSGGIERFLTTSDAHTGSRSLELPKDTPGGSIGRAYTPTDLGQNYVFSCWARSPIGFASSQGSASATIVVYWQESGVNKQAGLSALTLSSTTPRWIYRQTIIDLTGVLAGKSPDPGSVSTFVTLANANTAASILVDELRLSPVASRSSANVVDTKRWLLLAQIGTDGQSVRTIYDKQLEPVVEIGAEGEILSARFGGLSRQLPGSSGAFRGNIPNTRIDVSPGGNTQYDDFRGSRSNDWTFTEGAGATWTIAEGKLSYAGGSSGGLGGTAVPKTANTTNFAARIEVTPTSGASPAIGDGTIYLRWNAAAHAGKGGFELVSVEAPGTITVLQSATTRSLGAQWFFAAIDGVYLCSVDGVLLFSYDAARTPSSGRLTLAVDTAASFDELMRLDDPRLQIEFSDAQGRPIQRIAVLGRPRVGAMAGTFTLLSQGSLADTLGRSIIVRDPQVAPLALMAVGAAGSPQLLQGAPDQYLDDGQGSALTLPAYVAQGVSIPGVGTQLNYTTTYFEPSPLGRPIKCLPGRAFADASGNGFLQSFSYGGRSALPGATQSAGDPLIYRTQEATEEIGSKPTPRGGSETLVVQRGEVRDLDGRVLVRYSGPNSDPYSLREESSYDAAGRLVARTQANAAKPPIGTTAATWTERYHYDFLGRVVSHSSPDGGEVKFAYDSADRLRFAMDSEGAAAKVGTTVVQRIKYIRYDALGRAVEAGWIQDAGFQWGSAALLAQLDRQTFPKVAGGTGTGTSATGRWRQQHVYDGDGNPTTLYLLGRRWKTQSQAETGSNTVSETRTYDAFGRVTTSTRSVAGASETTTSYAYTPAGNLGSVTYPGLNGRSLDVGYYYDRLGRVAGVGQATSDREIVDPSAPVAWVESRYTAYDYGFASELTSVATNRPPSSVTPAFTRKLAYDAGGRLTDLTDPYLALRLGYEAADRTSYSGSRIGSLQASYLFGEHSATPLTAMTYAYDYDQHGRLTNASCETSQAYSFTTAATGNAGGYDLNGNRNTSRRGLTQVQLGYPTGAEAGKPGTPANGYASSTPSIHDTQDFSEVTGNQAGAWSWKSSNGGRSSSQLTHGDPHSGTQCLELGGGNALGHHEVLELDTYLSPNAMLTFTAYTRTAVGYVGTPGNQASWVLTLLGPAGRLADKVLASVPAGAAWTQQTISIDLPSIRKSLAALGEVTRAQLSLRNQTRGATAGQAGAAVFVDDLALSWNSPPSKRASYDQNGNLTVLPQRDLTFTYDSFSSRVESVTTAGGLASSWLYDAEGRVVRETSTSPGGGDATTVEHFYDLAGNLIAQQRTQGSTTEVSYFVHGPDGIVAAELDGKLVFPAKDHLGSVRAVVDGDSGATLASFDYLPFGGLSRAAGDQETLARFAGHPIDPTTGLVATPARTYDPDTGRFLQVDPRHDGQSPYAYALGDPINWVDPTGEVPIAPAIMWGTSILFYGYATTELMDAWQRYREDPWEFAAIAGASTVGLLVPYVAIRSLPALNWATSTFLRGAVLLTHSVLPTSVPIVTMIRQVGSVLVQKEIAAYAYRLYRGIPLGAEIEDPYERTFPHHWSYVVPFISENLGGPNWFFRWAFSLYPGLEARGGQPLRIHANAARPGLSVFFPANLNPAFDEHATGFYWVWPWTLRGNTDIANDVIRVGNFHGANLNYNTLGQQGLTLQHDIYSDFATVVDRNAHTTRYGGPAHIGSSTFIRKGLAVPAAAYAFGTNWLHLIGSWSYDIPLTYRLYELMIQ